MDGRGRGFFLGSASHLSFPGFYYDQLQHPPPFNQFGFHVNEIDSQPLLNTPEGRLRSLSTSSAASTSSASSSPDLESGNGKKSYEKWPEDEQKMLIHLWADNFDRLESLGSDYHQH